MSILSKDIEAKHKTDINNWPLLCNRCVKIIANNPNLNLSISMHMQKFMKFCPFVQKILKGNEILSSIKGQLRQVTISN